jgi:PAS domain S-box-containing protein
MNTQFPSMTCQFSRNIPPPGTMFLLSRVQGREWQVIQKIPNPCKPKTYIPEPLDLLLPLNVSDAVRNLIEEMSGPGDALSGYIPGGNREQDVRIIVSYLFDDTISLIWGDQASQGINLSLGSVHQGKGDIPDVLSRHDHEFIFSSATPSSFALFGYRPSELNGTSLLDYVHPEDLSHVNSCCLPLVTTPEVCRVRYRIKNNHGEYHWVESVFSSTFKPDGAFSVMMASTREMDAIVRAEQAARRANAKLNVLNGFIRHDMMNQITGMIGYLDILSELVDNENAQLLISKEQDLINRIRRFVDMTRDYQGIGLHPPGFICVDAVVHKILGRQEFAGKLTSERSLEGLFLYADRTFEQVIYELVENSLDYGGEQVVIRFWYEVTDEGLILVFEDNGPGIAPAEKEQIFSRTYKNRRGYGLYLVVEILDITGIRIRETGTLGDGARFEVIVPCDGYRITPLV